MKLKNILLLAIISLVTITGCTPEKKEEAKQEKITSVKTEKAQEKEVSKLIKLGSEAEPFKDVMHSSDTGGEVVEVLSRNGIWVEKGKTIVKLENTQIKAAYLQAQANYINAKSAYERAETFSEDQTRNSLVQAELALTSAKMTLKKARRGADEEQISQAELAVETAKKSYEVSKKTYEKNKRLFEKKLIAEQTFLNVEQAYKAAENGYKSAQESLELVKKGAAEEDLTTLEQQVKNAQAIYDLTKKMVDEKAWKYDIQAAKSGMLTAKASYELAKDNYEDLNITAKISGVIIDLDLDEDDKVTPGKALFSVINNDDMIVRVGLDEDEIVGVQMYDETNIKFDAIGKTFKGNVFEINPSADPKTKKFEIKIKLKNTDHLIKKGMYASISLVTEKHEGIVVPKQSILVEGIETSIFVVKDGLAKKYMVELGETSDEYQEVLGNKIKEGDRIILEGQYLLDNNDKVKEVE